MLYDSRETLPQRSSLADLYPERVWQNTDPLNVQAPININHARQIFFTLEVELRNLPAHRRASCMCQKGDRNWRGTYTFSPVYHWDPIEEPGCEDCKLSCRRGH